jgi:hypothetical protein
VSDGVSPRGEDLWRVWAWEVCSVSEGSVSFSFQLPFLYLFLPPVYFTVALASCPCADTRSQS